MERYTNHGLPKSKQCTWWLQAPLANGPCWGQAALCEANTAWFHKQGNTELALGTTLCFAVSDKHSIIRWPVSDGDSTSEMRKVISFRRIKAGLTLTLAKKRNFALSRLWGTLPETLFQRISPWEETWRGYHHSRQPGLLFYQQEMSSFQEAF